MIRIKDSAPYGIYYGYVGVPRRESYYKWQTCNKDHVDWSNINKKHFEYVPVKDKAYYTAYRECDLKGKQVQKKENK